MNWKRRMRRNFFFALLGGVASNLIYSGLLYTKALHGFAVAALGPAIDLVQLHLDPNCHTPLRCYLEHLAVNIVLYTFLILVVLTGIDVLRQLMRKLSR